MLFRVSAELVCASVGPSAGRSLVGRSDSRSVGRTVVDDYFRRAKRRLFYFFQLLALKCNSRWRCLWWFAIHSRVPFGPACLSSPSSEACSRSISGSGCRCRERRTENPVTGEFSNDRWCGKKRAHSVESHWRHGAAVRSRHGEAMRSNSFRSRRQMVEDIIGTRETVGEVRYARQNTGSGSNEFS